MSHRSSSHRPSTPPLSCRRASSQPSRVPPHPATSQPLAITPSAIVGSPASSSFFSITGSSLLPSPSSQSALVSSGHHLHQPASIFSSSPHLLRVLPCSDLRPCPDPLSRRPNPAARSTSLPRRPNPLRYAAALPKFASQPSLPRSALVGA